MSCLVTIQGNINLPWSCSQIDFSSVLWTSENQAVESKIPPFISRILRKPSPRTPEINRYLNANYYPGAKCLTIQFNSIRDKRHCQLSILRFSHFWQYVDSRVICTYSFISNAFKCVTDRPRADRPLCWFNCTTCVHRMENLPTLSSRPNTRWNSWESKQIYVQLVMWCFIHYCVVFECRPIPGSKSSLKVPWDCHRTKSLLLFRFPMVSLFSSFFPWRLEIWIFWAFFSSFRRHLPSPECGPVFKILSCSAASSTLSLQLGNGVSIHCANENINWTQELFYRHFLPVHNQFALLSPIHDHCMRVYSSFSTTWWHGHTHL